MNSLRPTLLSRTFLALVFAAATAACGQTIGNTDTGSDTADVATANDVLDDDSPSADVISNFDTISVDATDSSTTDSAMADVRPDSSPVVDVVTPPDAVTGCNATLADGPTVSFTTGVGTPPAATGGAITSGHYQLTSMTVYGGSPPPISVEEAIDINATTLNVVARPGGMPEQRISINYTINGNTMNTTQTCPAGGDVSSNQYTADATHLTIIQGGGGMTIVGTFQLH